MDRNVRIAREIVRIAREMVVGQTFYKEIGGKWSVYESDVADKLGFYRRFTGTIDYGETKATVKGADFGVYAQGHIVFKRGTWIDGTWSGGRWEGGTWLKGVWNGGDWYKGTWKNGDWNNGAFGHDETKKSDWMNGTFENGVFETGTWHGGVWKGGKWSDWHQNFWMKGTDGNGVVHGRGECPLKWKGYSNVVIASELVRIARLLVAGHENFGHYSIELDKAHKVFTVYFILKEDAVHSKALENVNVCRNEIENVLKKDKLIEVSKDIEDNEKSFCFTIVVKNEDKESIDGKEKKSSFGWSRVLVAAGDNDDSDEGDDGGDGGDDDSDDDGNLEEEKKEEKKEKVDPEELERFNNIKKTVEKTVETICRKYNWDTGK